jgi:CBS domain-containing protein
MQKPIEAKAIRDIMTASPITVYPDTSIRELRILCERYKVNAFPVVDDRGVLRGVVPRLNFLRVFRPDTRRRPSGGGRAHPGEADEALPDGSRRQGYDDR